MVTRKENEFTDYSAGSSNSFEEMRSDMSIDLLAEREGGVEWNGKANRKRVR